jgi:hypothetical protein
MSLYLRIIVWIMTVTQISPLIRLQSCGFWLDLITSRVSFLSQNWRQIFDVIYPLLKKMWTAPKYLHYFRGCYRTQLCAEKKKQLKKTHFRNTSHVIIVTTKPQLVVFLVYNSINSVTNRLWYLVGPRSFETTFYSINFCCLVIV